MSDLIEPKMYLEDVEGAWHVDEVHVFCPNCENDIEVIESNVSVAYGFRLTCDKCKKQYDFRIFEVET